jgi:hypothetical protein
MARPLHERFWKRITRLPSGCWVWSGYLDKQGYGRLNVAKRTRYAHIVAFELAGGSIPEGYTLDHLCRTRACVCPSHLEPVTRGENVLRGAGITAQNKRAESCKRGHRFTEQNTLWSRNKRGCRACAAFRKRRARQAA